MKKSKIVTAVIAIILVAIATTTTIMAVKANKDAEDYKSKYWEYFEKAENLESENKWLRENQAEIDFPSSAQYLGKALYEDMYYAVFELEEGYFVVSETGKELEVAQYMHYSHEGFVSANKYEIVPVNGTTSGETVVVATEEETNEQNKYILSLVEDGSNGIAVVLKKI